MNARASRFGLVLALALLLPTPRAGALTNGVALLPPLGFNSWYSYGSGVTEAIVKSVADAMATNGMLAAGYNYINVDDGWAGSRDTNGALVADTNKFPDGMKALADYVHAKGFKFGIYTTASSNTCAGYVGSQNHIVQDANTFAAWGVDYVKYEGCNISPYEIYPRQQLYLARMGQALAHTGRPIVYSCSIGGAFENWMPQYINLWRGTGDIDGNWSTVLSHIDFVSQTPQFAGPGGWNDMDGLEIGSGYFPGDEGTSIFSMWCILTSPLLVLGSETTHTITLCNADALAVNQDPAGIQGVCVSSNNNLQIWRKPLGGSNSSTLAVVLFNRGQPAANITANWSDLGFAPGVATVWDIWAKAYTGNFTNSYTANIPMRAVQFLKIVNGATMPLPPFGTNYVSDLPWLSDATNSQAGFGDPPLVKDLSAGSTTLSMRGVKYSKGLGMNGYTRVRYFVGGMATRFQAYVGIDDIAQNLGIMIFRVYGDGTKLYDSGALSPQNSAQSVDVDLTGYTSVSLEVTNATSDTRNEYSDWAEARITFPSMAAPAPAGLAAAPGANQFALSWYAESGVTNYVIKRATAPGGPYIPIVTNAAPVYTDTNVTTGVTYFYVISAVNAFGPSTNSLEIAASLPAYWTNTLTGASQNWNVNGNWTNTPVFPSRVGAAAVVSPAIASNQIINLNQNITLGGLVLGVTNGSAGINLAANGGILTFDNDTNPATLTDLAVGAGDTLSAPVVLNHNLAIISRSTNFLTLAGNISGPGSLTANGPGPLWLGGSNSFAGPVAINAGLLKIGNSAALGVTNGSVNIAGAATLDMNGFNLGGEAVTVAGAGYDGNGALISTAAVSQTNALRSLTLAGDTVLGGTARWDIRGASNLVASGVLSTGGNAFALTKTGTNQISLASLAIDPALGDINLDAGVLSFENATASMGDPAHPLNVQPGATLAFTQTVAAWNKNILLDGDGFTPSVTNSGSNALIGPVTISDTCLFNVTGSLSLNGPFSGDGALVKNLSGALIIGGTNLGDFEGEITVNAGTLAIQNAGPISGSSQITVAEGAVLDVSALASGLTLAAGQTLSGGGTVNGNLTIGSQATLQPDSFFGVPTFNNALTFAAGSACMMDVSGSPPIMNDQLRVLGNLTFAGTLIVNNLSGSNLAAGASFKLFNAANYSGAFSSIVPQFPGTNVLWDTSQLAVSGTLSVKTGALTHFTSYVNQGGNLLFSGTGGSANAPYYVLTSTNLAMPVAQWSHVATNYFDNQGNFTVTNTPNPGNRAIFYCIQVP